MAEITRLEIAKDSDSELWILTLFNEYNEPQLESNTPLSKGEVLNAAKVLKHEGFKASIQFEKADSDFKGWILFFEKDFVTLKLTSILATEFSFSNPKIRSSKDFDEIKIAFEEIQNNLGVADIEWNPPDENPAVPYSNIETQTKGHPGS